MPVCATADCFRERTWVTVDAFFLGDGRPFLCLCGDEEPRRPLDEMSFVVISTVYRSYHGSRGKNACWRHTYSQQPILASKFIIIKARERVVSTRVKSGLLCGCLIETLNLLKSLRMMPTEIVLPPLSCSVLSRSAARSASAGHLFPFMCCTAKLSRQGTIVTLPQISYSTTCICPFVLSMIQQL